MRRFRLFSLLLVGLVVLGLLPGAVASAAAGTAKIGNRVWEDLDGDGRQESGEPGLAGVTIELVDAGGSTIATRVTSDRGRWAFRVDAGSAWQVRVTAPAGRSFTAQNAVPNDARDSDADADGIITIGAGTLTAGTRDRDFDTGVRPVILAAQIGNRVWEDADGDGRQDSGEPGLAGVTVELVDAGGSTVATRVTNRKGHWRFFVDPSPAWGIRVTAPVGRSFTAQDAIGNDARDSDADADGLIAIGAGSLTGGVADRSFDAGVRPLASAPLFNGNAGGVTLLIDAAENQTAVTDLEATDADGDTENGGGLTYSLTVGGEGDDNALFGLDTDTGVLTFLSAPDFENPTDDLADNLYLVQVQVTDSGGLIDIQDVTVTVTDVLETPEITSDGGGATAAVDAAENQTAVTDVEAAAPNGDTEGDGLTYTLTGDGGGGCGDLLRCDARALPTAGVDNGLFSLDPNSGVLTFTEAPDFEAPSDDNLDGDYKVQVTVTDSDANTDTQDLTIIVTNLDEAPAIISDGGGATAGLDTAENTTAVTDVEALDSDGDSEGAGLTYALTTETGGGADNDRFMLDTTTGVLAFASAPDFENPVDSDGDNDYLVAIEVTDSSGLADYQSLTVTVTDVAETPITGTITVTLTALVPGPDVITFSEDITAAATFMLDDNPASGMPNTITFENVTPGSYSVSRAPFSLMLVGNGCTDTDAGGVMSVMDLATGVATINLEAGETVACTFLGIFE